MEAADVEGERLEAVVTAFMASMREYFGAIPGGVWVESPDLVRYSTGRLGARLNGVAVLGQAADEAEATAWLADLEAAGTPHCVLGRPDVPSWVTELARAHDLGDLHHEPLMVHTDPASVSENGIGPVLTRVDPHDRDEVELAQRLFTEGFGGPMEVIGDMMGAEVLAVPGTTAWVGRDGGVPCTTGLGALAQGHIGVFNIATPPEHRRRGHGRAVTARVVAAGVAEGAHTAYLQASPMGLPVYEAMGFRTVETWPCHYPTA